MRVLYLDEAGIGQLDKDPFLVVAGVLINADEHWLPLADELRDLLERATPLGVQVPSHIHAKDIFHGSREFGRKDWPEQVRRDLLRRVGELPAKYDLPVVWSAIDRREFAAERPQDTPSEHTTDCYSVCAMACLMKTEVYMRSLSQKSEMVSVVLEQNNEIQRRVPSLVAFLREPGEAAQELSKGWERCIPPRHLIDTPASHPKTSSSILQVADYCAFAIKRKLQGARNFQELTEPIAPQLLTFRDADEANRNAAWNPKFMPHVYANMIEFRDGMFRRVSKQDGAGD